ncbi:hypothetical protein EKO04_011590 [Ascochyta lentis]|uniref:Uncharacterized protein n=1 Tax=Ascochyta lentis TaxID=205686 RepID=A0A8H7MER3_9PLEO|nr:hypothetical protein EKO04_011590 [Ascochyta lentis]
MCTPYASKAMTKIRTGCLAIKPSIRRLRSLFYSANCHSSSSSISESTFNQAPRPCADLTPPVSPSTAPVLTRKDPSSALHEAYSMQNRSFERSVETFLNDVSTSSTANADGSNGVSGTGGKIAKAPGYKGDVLPYRGVKMETPRKVGRAY